MSLHLEAERVILRTVSIEDAPDMFEYAHGDVVGPVSGWPPHQSLEVTQNHIQNVVTAAFDVARATSKQYINPNLHYQMAPTFGVFLKETGKMIGTVNIKDTFSCQYELYQLRDAWNVAYPKSNFNSQFPPTVKVATEIDESGHLLQIKQGPDGPVDEAALNLPIFNDFDERYVRPELVEKFPIYSPYSIKALARAEQESSEGEGAIKYAKFLNAVEIGYALNPAFWGQGLIPEAVKCLLNYIWSWPCAPKFVFITTITTNRNSQSVAGKVGGRLFSAMKAAFTRYDQLVCDGMFYVVRNPNIGEDGEPIPAAGE